MKLLVLGEAGYAALKVCYQVYYCPDADSMAATHGDDIIAEGEPEELDRLDEVSKRLVVVEVPDRIRPGAEVHGQCLKRSKGSRSAGRIGGAGGEAVPQDTGMSVCVSNGRFDMRFCVERLSARMSKPRKMGNLRLTRLSRCVVQARRSSLAQI